MRIAAQIQDHRLRLVVPRSAHKAQNGRRRPFTPRMQAQATPGLEASR